jgi:hypothetical protein
MSNASTNTHPQEGAPATAATSRRRLQHSHAAAPLLDLAIATLAAPMHPMPKDAMCGMVKWCSQARILAEQVLAPRWQAEVVAITPLSRLEDCPNAHLVAWDDNLEARLRAYMARPDIVRGRTERPCHERRCWLALNLQKLQAAPIVSRRSLDSCGPYHVRFRHNAPSASRRYSRWPSTALSSSATGTLTSCHNCRARDAPGACFSQPSCEPFCLE